MSINSCIKNSILYINGTIQPRYLTINERVRQFGGHPTYARFLMFLGLGLLSRKRKELFFKAKRQGFVNIPREIAGQEIVKQFECITVFTFILYMKRFSYVCERLGNLLMKSILTFRVMMEFRTVLF